MLSESDTALSSESRKLSFTILRESHLSSMFREARSHWLIESANEIKDQRRNTGRGPEIKFRCAQNRVNTVSYDACRCHFSYSGRQGSKRTHLEGYCQGS